MQQVENRGVKDFYSPKAMGSQKAEQSPSINLTGRHKDKMANEDGWVKMLLNIFTMRETRKSLKQKRQVL